MHQKILEEHRKQSSLCIHPPINNGDRWRYHQESTETAVCAER